MKTILAMLAVVLTLPTGYAQAAADDEVKATFDRFVAAQNAHDVSAVRDLLFGFIEFPVGDSRRADLGA